MAKIKLIQFLPGLVENWPLAKETNFGLGGPARFFFRAKTKADLLAALTVSTKLKLKTLVIGSGTNLVVADRGFFGLVIKFEYQGPISKVLQVTANHLVAEASISLMDLLKSSFNHNLAGLEKLSGIPGTLGGALVGNAGAYGQSISDHLVSVEIFDGRKICLVPKSALRFTYRDSLLKHKLNWLVLSATFVLPAGDKKLLQAESKKIIRIRNGKYPPGIKSAGSFFKNFLVTKIPKRILKNIPANKIINGKIPTGYLLEDIGVKTLAVGGIQVAPFHANFLLNTGAGTTRQLKKLVQKLKQRTRSRFGLELEEEIRYID